MEYNPLEEHGRNDFKNFEDDELNGKYHKKKKKRIKWERWDSNNCH